MHNLLSNIHMQFHKHHMFYDETNNFRKLILDREEGTLNTDRDDFKNNVFYLGGIALTNNYAKEASLKNAFDVFKQSVAPNNEELKFENVAKRDFLSVLKSTHLNRFLKLLTEYDVCIHYSACDMIYLAVTELIDELEVINSFYALYPQYKNELINRHVGAHLKNTLHGIFNTHRSEFLAFMVQTNFPKIQDSAVFFPQLLCFIESLRNNENTTDVDMILNVYNHIEDPSDVYVDGYDQPEKGLLLINNFAGCYLMRTSTLTNCIHTFDREVAIQDVVLKANKSTTIDLEFVDSKSDYRIQMSDIFIGFFRKFFDYALSEPFERIRESFNQMNPSQKECLRYFFKILNYSEQNCEYFTLYVMSIDDKEKSERVFKYYQNALSAQGSESQA